MSGRLPYPYEDDDEAICWGNADDEDEMTLTSKEVSQFQPQMASSSRYSDEERAKDERFVYWGLVFTGVGLLLPFNSFVLATDYYMQRFPNTRIVFSLNLVYLVVTFITTLISNLAIESVKYSARVTCGLLISLLAILVIVVLDLLLELFALDTAYTVTLAMAAISAIGASLAQTSIYGYTAMLPKCHSQAVMVGESVAGALACAARLVIKAIVVRNLTQNTALFFCIALAMLLLAVLLFHGGHQKEFVRQRVESCYSAATQVYHECRDREKLGLTQQRIKQVYGTTQSDSKSTDSEPIELDVTAALKNRWLVMKEIWGYPSAMALTYCVTAAIYPGIFSLVISSNLGTWMPLMLYSIYNVLDLGGKILSKWTIDWTGQQMLLWAMTRLILVPVVLLCAAPITTPVLAHEAYPSLLAAILGISNGYLGSSAILLASHALDEGKREVAGNVMILALCFGVASGSGFAFLLDWVVTQTGPTNSSVWTSTISSM